MLSRPDVLIFSAAELPDQPGWLAEQACPVIVYGDYSVGDHVDSDHVDSDYVDNPAPINADVVVSNLAAAQLLQKRIAVTPIAAMTLVQVLRASEKLPAEQGLDIESLAYSTLLAGKEFAAWRNRFVAEPIPDSKGAPLLLDSAESIIKVTLNRPELRNSITVEMRDALLEVLDILYYDDSIKQLEIRANGPCFSVGGELREFGSAPDQGTAHWVRSVHSPARMLLRLSERITCYVHGACIGSGMELPLFAAHVVAHNKTFFHLPELELGLIPGAGGTVSIARRIGRHRTAWLLLSGRRINAATALSWGLIDEIAEWNVR